MIEHVQSSRQSVWSARDVARLGMMLALASAIHLFESRLPALPIPGAKIGLANVVSLFILYTWGFKEAFFLTVMRQIVGSFLTGTLFAPAFLLGLSGGMISVVVMALGKRAGDRLFSPVAVSLLGAAAHNVGQLLAARWLLGHVQIFYYLPYLLLFAIPSGALVGMTVQHVLPLAPTMKKVAGKDLVHADSPTETSRLSFRVGHRSPWVVGTALAVVGIMLATGIFRPQQSVMANPHAQISVGNEIIALHPLHDDQSKEVSLLNGELILELKDGRVRVAKSTCDNQVCVRTGWIHLSHQSIVCLPYQVMITIVGVDNADPELDAIIF